MATIGELAVNVTARTGGLSKGLARARGGIAGFTKSAKGVDRVGGMFSKLLGPIAAITGGLGLRTGDFIYVTQGDGTDIYQVAVSGAGVVTLPLSVAFA